MVPIVQVVQSSFFHFLNNREDKLFHILINRIKDKTLRKRELTIEEDLVTSYKCKQFACYFATSRNNR